MIDNFNKYHLAGKKPAITAPHRPAGLVVLGGQSLRSIFRMMSNSLHILWGEMIPFHLQQNSASVCFPTVNKRKSSSLRHHQILLDYLFASVKGIWKDCIKFFFRKWYYAQPRFLIWTLIHAAEILIEYQNQLQICHADFLCCVHRLSQLMWWGTWTWVMHLCISSHSAQIHWNSIFSYFRNNAIKQDVNDAIIKLVLSLLHLKTKLRQCWTFIRIHWQSVCLNIDQYKNCEWNEDPLGRVVFISHGDR